MANIDTQIKPELIENFCREWNVIELSLFGSVLRGDFNDASDVDIMVSFKENAGWSLLDHVTMRDELIRMIGRDVDLVTRKGVERSRNVLRRTEILKTAKVLYAAS